MAGLKDLAKLMGQVPQDEPINIEVAPKKWVVPFQGMWLFIHDHRVPPLQAMSGLKLMDGCVLLFFEDGTAVPLYCIRAIEPTIEQAKAFEALPRDGFDPIMALGQWIEGLDLDKYKAVRAAQQKVAAAKAEYLKLMKSLGQMQEQGSDYNYQVCIHWHIPGVPTVMEWV